MKRILKVLMLLTLILTGIGITNTTVKADDEWTEVRTEAELRTAIESGGNIKLGNDILFDDDNINIKNSVTIDLNNKTLYSGCFFEVMDNSSNLTIVDNSSERSGVLEVDIFIYGGNFTLNSGTIKKIIRLFNDGVITMNGGIINTGTGSALYFCDGVFHANGGEIISVYSTDADAGVGLYDNESNLVTDEGCSGTIFNSTAYTYGSVSGGIYNKQFKNIDGTISGGTFNSNVINNGTITGGTFNSNVINNGAITGGTFTDISGNGSISGENTTVNGAISGGTIYGPIKGNYTINGLTVTFKNGNTDYAKQIVQSGNKVTSITSPTKEGYTFTGWYTDETCTTLFDFDNTSITDDMTLYAGYSANDYTNDYTIIFDTDGGSTIEPITQEYGTTITVPSDPTKVGYIFAGWDKTIPSTMPASDMTIKAIWKECDHSGNTNSLSCTKETICSECGGTIFPISHDYSSEAMKKEALKTKGTCTNEAVYIKSCSRCGKVDSDMNNTFLGDKDSNNHSNLVHYMKNEATTERLGNIEYWYCEGCKKYYSDSKATKEITKEDTVIAKLTPEIIKGNGASVIEGEKKILSFTSNASYSDFESVKIDGKELDGSNYTVKEGSTIITLKEDYISKLSVGIHTIEIVSESGTAKGAFTIIKKSITPTTSDTNHLLLWISLIGLSGIVGILFVKSRKYVK